MRFLILIIYCIFWTNAIAQQPHWFPLKESPSEADLNIIECGLDTGLVYTTDGVRVWKSINYGKQWEEIFDAWSHKPEPMELFGASALVQHPKNPGTLYLGSEMQGILWTEDYGETWKRNPLDNDFEPSIPVLQVGVDPYSNVILAGSARTTTNFKSFTVMDDIEPADLGGYGFLKSGDIIATEVGLSNPLLTISKSLDKGKTWKEMAKLSANGVIAIAPIVVDKSDYVYVGAGVNGKPVVFKSIDKGDTWTPLTIETDTSGSNVIWMSCHRETNTLYAMVGEWWFQTTIGQIYASTDGGIKWQRIRGNPYAMGMSHFEVSHDNHVFTSSVPYGVQHYDIKNKMWHERIKGLRSSYYMHGLHIDSADNLFALSEFGGVHINRDLGSSTWKRASALLPPGQRDTRVLVSTRDGSMHFSVRSGKLYESSNGGETWSLLPALQDGIVGSMLQLDREDKIYSGYRAPGAARTNLVVSSDKGKTWDTLLRSAGFFRAGWDGKILAFFIRPIDSFSSQSFLLRSVNGGLSWDTLNDKLPDELKFHFGFKMYSDYKGRFYIAADLMQIYYSDDYGDTWHFASQLRTDYYPPNTYELAFDRKNNAYLTMSWDSSIFYSTDGCKTWQPKSSGFPVIEALRYAVEIVFDKNDVPYALDNRGIVYKYGIPEPDPTDTSDKPVDTTQTSGPHYPFYASIDPSLFIHTPYLHYLLPEAGEVSVTLFDMLGRELAGFTFSQNAPGEYRNPLHVHLRPACYIAHIRYGNESRIQKIIKQ